MHCKHVFFVYLQIFSKYGQVMKIVTFNKNSKLFCTNNFHKVLLIFSEKLNFIIVSIIVGLLC